MAVGVEHLAKESLVGAYLIVKKLEHREPTRVGKRIGKGERLTLKVLEHIAPAVRATDQVGSVKTAAAYHGSGNARKRAFVAPITYESEQMNPKSTSPAPSKSFTS